MHHQKEFSIGAKLKFGWNAMKEHLFFFIIVMIVGVILQASPGFFSNWSTLQEQTGYNTDLPQWLLILLAIIFFFVSLIINLGFINISLDFVDGKKANFWHLFNQYKKVFSYLVALIIYIIVVAVGFIFFVVPGLYLAVRLSLFPYFIVDKDVGPIHALKLSSDATTGAKWDLFGLYIVSIFVTYLGFLCLIIGLFAAVPTVWVATASAYRHVAGGKESCGCCQESSSCATKA